MLTSKLEHGTGLFVLPGEQPRSSSVSSAPPLGGRGARPVMFTGVSASVAREVLGYSVGSAVDSAGNLCCAWDNAFLVAKLLGLSAEAPPIDAPVALAGLDEYKSLGLHKKLRDYQKEAVRWLVRRAYGINGDPMRSGKTLSLLAASVALGAERVLIIAPALAKWVWADEIRKWIGQDALILEGRAGTTAVRTADGLAAANKWGHPTLHVKGASHWCGQQAEQLFHSWW